ncbi:hypothetical protein IWQ57_004477 [Coemansia nantahalensis]|uniref:Uncharacterized protein n=2 Tax=Coemansia TaxID=4863 RepID=A0ACC1LDA1_9FUNG|nr:hypothetical protein IWQ57_004477 [Coemansia nantahalensis]KAJ2805891.1 hypothetical protein H4R21_001090 [Coemansia helicoidea]
MSQQRTYTDKFKERETAAENKYAHDKEKAQLEALRAKLDKAAKDVDALEAEIKKRDGAKKQDETKK